MYSTEFLKALCFTILIKGLLELPNVCTLLEVLLIQEKEIVEVYTMRTRDSNTQNQPTF